MLGKGFIKNGKKLHDMLNAYKENILKQMENELDLRKVAELQGKLIDIRDFKNRLENQMGEQIGVQGGVQEFSGDEATDNATRSYLWNYSNGDNFSCVCVCVYHFENIHWLLTVPQEGGSSAQW